MRQEKVGLNNSCVFRLPKKGPYYEEWKRGFGTKELEKITNLFNNKGYDGLMISGVPVMGRGVSVREVMEVVRVS